MSNIAFFNNEEFKEMQLEYGGKEFGSSDGGEEDLKQIM